MDVQELQRLIDQAEPEDRMALIRGYIMEHHGVVKAQRVGGSEIMPRHILGLGTSSATINASASKASHVQFIRFVFGPIKGGPYSVRGDQVKGDGTLNQPIVTHVDGLAPGTTYYFRVQIVDEDGTIVSESDEQSFTTLPHNSHVKPAVEIKMTSARLIGDANVGASERARLVYGVEGEEKFRTVEGKENILTDLSPGINYWCTLQILDVHGNILDESLARTFKTLKYSAEASVFNVKVSQATFKGTVNYVPSSEAIRFVYRTAKKGSQWITAGQFAGIDSKDQEAVLTLTGLTEETDYLAKVQVVRGNAVMYESSEVKFSTLSYNFAIDTAEVRAAAAKIVGFVDYVDPDYTINLLWNDVVVAELKGRLVEGQLIYANLDDLVPLTEYNIKLRITNGDQLIAEAEDKAVTTAHSPIITDVINIKDRTATLIGSADFIQRKGFTRFAWQKSDRQPFYSPLMFGENKEGQRFAYLAFGLEVDSEYVVRLQVVASDGVTVTDESEPREFKTEPIRRRKI